MRYIVKGTSLRHNGKIYENGDTVEMSEAKATDCTYLVPAPTAADDSGKGRSKSKTSRNSRNRGKKKTESKSDGDASGDETKTTQPAGDASGDTTTEPDKDPAKVDKDLEVDSDKTDE